MKKDNSNIKIWLVAAILATAFLAAFTIPVGNTNDIYVNYIVSQPTLSTPKLTTAIVTAHPHTFIQSPEILGNILFSGNVVVVAATQSREARINVGTVYVGFDAKGTVVIRDVPPEEKVVTVSIYENGLFIEARTVTLP